MDATLLIGDCREVLKTLDSESVNCCVTSPPYWGLRSYDENAVCIDPQLDATTKNWLIQELDRSGIRARH